MTELDAALCPPLARRGHPAAAAPAAK